MCLPKSQFLSLDPCFSYIWSAKKKSQLALSSSQSASQVSQLSSLWSLRVVEEVELILKGMTHKRDMQSCWWGHKAKLNHRYSFSCFCVFQSGTSFLRALTSWPVISKISKFIFKSGEITLPQHLLTQNILKFLFQKLWGPIGWPRVRSIVVAYPDHLNLCMWREITGPTKSRKCVKL